MLSKPDIQKHPPPPGEEKEKYPQNWKIAPNFIKFQAHWLMKFDI